MLYYFDSSIAVKRYAPEKDSARVKNLMEPSAGNKVYISQIGIVEIAAALSKKVRTKELMQVEYEAALKLFLQNVRQSDYIINPVNELIIDLAVDLTTRHPLRGYDAVHLATAVSINNALIQASFPPVIFASADKLLLEAAGREGLSIYTN